MDRLDYTPTKTSKIFTSNSYSNIPMRQVAKFTSQSSVLRQMQTLKAQARQLQIQNKQLVNEVQRLKYQKGMSENKLLQKANFESNTIAQFQKQKNYQIDMLKIKNEEDLNRLKRQYEIKLQQTLRQIKSKQNHGKQLAEKYNYLQNKNNDLKTAIDKLQIQLAKFRQSNSGLTEELTRQQFANKKLQMLAEEYQRQKNQMESQIIVLLDIQAQKSTAISILEQQIQQSQNSQANLHQKFGLLTQNFASLQQHITIMKERITTADDTGEKYERNLRQVQLQILDRQNLLKQQRQRQLCLRNQIEEHKHRQYLRIQQIRQILRQNQEAYQSLNQIRFKLYDVSIDQAIDL